MNHFPWRTAFRIGWREARAAKGKFVFVILAVAAGVGAITGVRGFGEAFRGMLLREARTLMAADLSVRMFEMPDTAQSAAMTALERKGIVRTWITETVSMVSAPNLPDPLLVSVKAVEPSLYPFYGQIRLSTGGTLRDKLTPDTVVVSADLLLRLDASIGDTIRLGESDYRIAAIVTMEPDRMTGSLNVGPRVMLSREGLDRSKIMVPGSRASQRFLFKLPSPGPGVETIRAELQRVFPSTLIADFRQTHPLITRGLNRATTFLSLVSLISLIVGALGVATAVHSHLRQRMDSIAVMKCLGAASPQIIRIYLLQTLSLGLIGSLAGVAVGFLVQAAFPALLSRYFPIGPGIRIDFWTLLQGMSAGILTTLLFTWPPLAGIRRIRPGLILRRDMPEARLSWTERRRNLRSAAVGGAVILAGLGVLAATLAGGSLSYSARIGGWFAGGLFVSLVLMAGFGKLLLAGLKAVVEHGPITLPATVRHGLANLYRPGTQTPFILAALGVGVMFTLTVFLVQRSMLLQMIRSAPPEMPNVFLINVTERERAGLLDLLSKQPGVEKPPEVVAAVSAKLESIDGVPVEKASNDARRRRFYRTRLVTHAEEKPSDTEIVSGQWWDKRNPGPPQVSVSEDAAEVLHIQPGARLEFSASGRTFSAQVSSIHRTEAVRPGSSVEFVFTPGALEGLPAIYYGGMRVRAKDVAALQRAAYRRYPTVTIVNAADVLEIVQEVVDQIAIVVRFVSSFAILAGAIVLASSVAGTRFRRVREIAIFKALGATRRRVSGIFSIEFIVLGAVAGLMGSILATAFSALLLQRFFDAGFRFDPVPNLLAIVFTALLATSAGWLAGYRILGRKPLEVLRNE